MIITVTEREAFRRCRRMWDFSSEGRQGIAPIVNPSMALNLGTLVHRTLADWTLDVLLQKWCRDVPNTEPGKLSELFMYHASMMVLETEQRYRKAVGFSPSVVELAPVLSAVELGRCMMDNYQARYGLPIPEKYTFVMPEQEVMVPIPGTERICTLCENYYNIPSACIVCSSTGTERHYLKGKLDGLVQDEKGVLYVLERKTFDKKPNMAVLESNNQFLAYMWIVNQLDIGKCGGILYDGLYKRAVPKKGETLRDLFIRTKLYRTDHELNEFGAMLVHEANEMSSNPPLYINRPWMGCFDCGYQDLCTATSKGEDVDYIRSRLYATRTADVSALKKSEN